MSNLENDKTVGFSYDPFGMITLGRSWDVGSGYRYGFNGKESDSETYGDGNVYDYGFRIYNPRLGKFLSTDPLSKNYPWYTPYQFAGNRPINSIDLDGLEDVEVAVTESPSYGTPGEAQIKISLDYIVVTLGAGSVDPHRVSEINPEKFKQIFSSGNLTGLKLETLPSPNTEAAVYFGPENFVTPWFEKSGYIPQSFFNTDIIYDFSISCQPDVDICEAIDWVNENPTGRGIIFQSSYEVNSKVSAGIPNESLEYWVQSWSNFTMNMFKDTNIGAASLNSYLFEQKAPAFNIIAINGNFVNPGDSNFATFTEVLAHEVGHNLAETNRHGTGRYEYQQEGLQSNQRGRVRPTKSNTMDIINDSTNRNNN